MGVPAAGQQFGVGAPVAVQQIGVGGCGVGAPVAVQQIGVGGCGVALPAAVPQIGVGGCGVGPPVAVQQIGVGGCGGIGPNGLDTITILAYKEKNLNEAYLRDWFAEIPGFVALHANDRIGACFVKFANTTAAEQGLQAAISAQFGAEW